MKTISVTFPDGSVREVPAIERMQQNREIPPRNPTSTLTPAFDPDWEFTAMVGGWRARPRG